MLNTIFSVALAALLLGTPAAPNTPPPDAADQGNGRREFKQASMSPEDFKKLVLKELLESTRKKDIDLLKKDIEILRKMDATQLKANIGNGCNIPFEIFQREWPQSEGNPAIWKAASTTAHQPYGHNVGLNKAC